MNRSTHPNITQSQTFHGKTNEKPRCKNTTVVFFSSHINGYLKHRENTKTRIVESGNKYFDNTEWELKIG